MENIIQQTYEFYFKQYEYIVNNAYSNPKIRIKCLNELKQDIVEWKEINSEVEENHNIRREIYSLLHYIEGDLAENQKIIDRNKTK